MFCSSCSHPNPEDNRFCGMCGARLERRHASDAELLPEDADHPGPAYVEAFDTPSRKAVNKPARAATSTERPARAAIPAPLPEREARQAPPRQERLYAAEPDPVRFDTPLEPQQRNEGVTYRGFDLSGGADNRPTSVSSDETNTSVSGPSFLGLSSEEPSNSDYLLHDDAPRHGGRMVFIFLVLLGVAGLVYAQWQANGKGKTLFAGMPSIRAPRPVTAQNAPAMGPDQNSSASKPDMAVEPTNADLKKQAQEQAKDNSAQPQNTEQTKPNADAGKNAKAPEEADHGAKPAGDEASEEQPVKEMPAETKPAPKTSAARAKPPAAAARPHTPPKATPANDETAAMLSEGQRLLYGQGVHKNCQQALNIIHTAANRGNAEARAQLGGMYATGNCAPFDRVMAYRWFTLALASEGHSPSVQRTRDMLWREMTDTERLRARNSAD